MTVTTTQNVTTAQIAACTRCYDVVTSEAYYRVASATTEGQEYTVKAIRKEGKYFLTCNCKAGQNGVNCWHKRASVAHAAEVKANEVLADELYQLTLRADRLEEMGLTREEAWEAVTSYSTPNDDETLVRVFGPKHRRPSEAEMNRDAARFAGKGFSLLKK